MSEENKPARTFEIRFYLTRAFADAVRAGKTQGIEKLTDVLSRYGATLENQLDEFQDHLMRWQEIANWEEAFPDPGQRANEMWFEKFTLATVLNDRKREYLSREFTLAIDEKKFFSGNEVDAIVADLEALGPEVIGTGPRIEEPVTRRVYSDNGGPHSRATGVIPEKKM